ncbi:MAG TPA: putative porin [Ideonella sp.]|uniref:putative porin n=1 Tax=Ideonella sp. TaxID=1929293 RepID=UPI002E31204D|nr:putative porin [Ideonella sp.]HEX5682700.1 putative porin [Ideonella sp.]
MTPPTPRPARLAPLTVALLAAAAIPALAQTTPPVPVAAPAAEAAALTELRATTLSLIEALVEQGLLTRAKADELLRRARAAAEKGGATAAAPATGWGAPKSVVRVPYLSETTRAQIKDEVRNDVLATARDEGWTDGRRLPSWLKAVTIEGDMRVRSQAEMLPEDNVAPEIFRAQTDSPAWAPDLLNTQHDRHRMTLRARLGVTAKASDSFSAGLRIATGSTSGSPTSESATLGNGGNRLTIGVDRAWLRWEPRHGMRIEGGRLAVPFDGTDLLWPDDLGLDGVAGRGELDLASGLFAFATAGAFPLEEFANTTRDKWLLGGQAGIDWAFGSAWQLRASVGVYQFRNIEGVRENELPPTGALAGVRPYQSSAYPAAIRQKGNTLINLNAPQSTAAPVWGLASRFRPVDLTLALTSRHYNPYEAVLSFDVVKNTAFDLDDIERRAGTSSVSGLRDKTLGYQAKLLFGTPKLVEPGHWQAFAAYRHFERDAWVDAYTDTTWHLGGTNYKGYSVGAQYAFETKATVGLRFTSTRNLDDGVRFLAIPGDPLSISGNLSSAPMKIDVLQLEANLRF